MIMRVMSVIVCLQTPWILKTEREKAEKCGVCQLIAIQFTPFTSVSAVEEPLAYQKRGV